MVPGQVGELLTKCLKFCQSSGGEQSRAGGFLFPGERKGGEEGRRGKEWGERRGGEEGGGGEGTGEEHRAAGSPGLEQPRTWECGRVTKAGFTEEVSLKG